MSFDPTLNQACQTAHFFSGAFLVAFAVAVRWPMIVGVGACLAFALFKEFVFDIFVEGDKWGWPGSLMDFTFYQLGAMVAVGLLYLVNWWGQQGADND